MPRLARPARRWFPLLAALAVVGAWSLGVPSHAQTSAPHAPDEVAAPAADPGAEAQFVSRINSLRASKGLRQLKVDGELLGVARRWTDRMVSDGQISHNPNLGSQVSGSWTKLGENVGVGNSVDGLMDAFIDSPAHYRNLVDPDWNYVAVGVSYGRDGRLYTTHNFMAKPTSAPPPPTPPPPPPSNTTPTTQDSSPSTTAPPPPTTTTTVPPPEPEPTEDRVTAVLVPLRSLEQG